MIDRYTLWSITSLSLLPLLGWQGAAPTPRAQPAGPWATVAVISIPSDAAYKDTEQLLHVGFRNKSRSARLICVAGWAYSIQDAQYTSGHAEGGSPSCMSASSFSLVLAHETVFTSIPIKPEDIKHGEGDLGVTLAVRDQVLDPRGWIPESLTLTWRGKVKDAIAEGARLVRPSGR